MCSTRFCRKTKYDAEDRPDVKVEDFRPSSQGRTKRWSR